MHPSYTSSEMTTRSCSIATLATAAISRGVATCPVGLWGVLNRMARVLEVTAAFRLFALTSKPVFSSSGSTIGMPPAARTTGRYLGGTGGADEEGRG